MERVAIADDFETAVGETVTVLRRGQVVILPTETVYGLAVRADDANAVEALRRLKGRSSAQPFQVLVTGIDMAVGLGAVFSPGARRLAGKVWPGPLTLVTPTAGEGGTLGLRVPDSEFVLRVVRDLGRPLAATSANPHGEAPPTTADAADRFGEAVPLLVDGGPSRVGVASSVVKAEADGGFEILREGALTRDEIAAIWMGDGV